MQNPLFDFLRSALIPELSAYISACAASDVHLGLIAIMAVGAFPYEFAVGIGDYPHFAVVPADLTIIALGVEFRVHYVLVNVLHQFEYGRNVILHVRHFDVTYRAARRVAGTRFQT